MNIDNSAWVRVSVQLTLDLQLFQLVNLMTSFSVFGLINGVSISSSLHTGLIKRGINDYEY